MSSYQHLKESKEQLWREDAPPGGDNVYEGIQNPLADDQVAYSPGGGSVVFGHPASDARNNKRMKWIVIIVVVIAVCLLLAILGSVFMVYMRPSAEEQVADPCTVNPCGHGSTCTSHLEVFECMCPSGYQGTFCTIPLAACVSSPCGRGATCHDTDGGYRCQCPQGYTGINCDIDVNECLSEPCLNQATCHDAPHGYSCVCASGYDGTHCEKELDECRSNPCLNSGVCLNDQAGYRCHCVAGYTGLRCEADLNECDSNPCVHGGICHNKQDSHYCQCLPGYTGLFCETDIDECASAPCRHGATCIDHTDSFVCRCAELYTGTYCESDLNDCSSSPCVNGATCTDGDNSYTCACPLGFSGTNCETISGITPTCPAGFFLYASGRRCYSVHERDNEEHRDQASELCAQHGATLANTETQEELTFVGTRFTWEGRYHILGAKKRSDGDFYWSNGARLLQGSGMWSSGEPGSYDCVSCIMRNNETELHTYDCSNARPYVCERNVIMPANVTDCRLHPCLNGATCRNDSHAARGYRCVCTPGFSGPFCTEDMDECLSDPCDNGATCENRRGEFACLCPEGYTDATCQTNIDDCASAPCRNDATCVDGLGEYRCVCPANYTGPHCESGPDDFCPFGFEFWESGGRCYYIEPQSGTSRNYDNAVDFCQDQYASQLVSLETFAEMVFVGRHIDWTGRYHVIGARRTSSGQDFSWLSGATLTLADARWSGGEPGSDYCVAMIHDSGGDDDFHGISCTLARPFICERSVMYPPGTTNCRSYPCRNGASCRNVTSGYECDCTAGYTGQNCETDIDYCLNDPCQNNATCYDDVTTFGCRCTPGFTGDICDENVDDCLSHQCRHNSTCVDGIDEYTCMCKSNYTGRYCDTGPDSKCQSSHIYYEEVPKCYYIEETQGFPHEKDPEDAQEVCEDLGGSLASFETHEELQFVGSFFNWTGRYHVVGAKRRSGQFTWYSGETLSDSDTSWSSGEPGSYDCVAAIKDSGSARMSLYTLSCTSDRPYVCELPVLYPPGTTDCRSMPCLHGATCHNVDGVYSCECPAGWTGQNCETDFDDCLSRPCRNNATCHDHQGSYSCDCGPGFTGTSCEAELDECSSNPCHNGATCIDRWQSYLCVCAENYTGSNCESDIYGCPPDFIHRREHSRCYYLQERSSMEIVYEDAQSVCESKQATLVSLETTEEMLYVGSQFQETGRYHIVSARRAEDGDIYWATGEHLDSADEKWSSGHPEPGSDCVAMLRSSSTSDSKLYSMSCSYARPYVCERAIYFPPWVQDCRREPCLNRATCHNVNSTYRCECPPGFSGVNCETNIDECASNPCHNGATCNELINEYTCDCVPGYTGTNCETDIDECASSPCINGGQCMNGADRYTCTCTGVYTGANCETDSTISCPSNFIIFHSASPRCYLIREEPSDELSWANAEEYCQHKNATLAVLDTQEHMDFVGSKFNRTGRYHIIGARREADTHFYWNSGVMLSHESPSWHSGQPGGDSCVAVIRSGSSTTMYTMECILSRPYVCQAKVQLPSNVHDCRSAPCQNVATCHDRNNSYVCECAPGFTGLYCETDIDDCVSTPCLYGATCVDMRGSYRCQCAPGYTGTNCQTDIDDCASSPCYNDATCEDGIHSYTCVCAANYTGSACDIGPNQWCPAGFLLGTETSSCYYFQEDRSHQLNRSAAAAECRRRHAELASLETEAEANLVGGHFTWPDRYHHIGARRNTSGDFYWTSGKLLSSAHPSWASGQPGSYDCVVALYEYSRIKFHSYGCDDARPYVCERDVVEPILITSCTHMICANGGSCQVSGSTYSCGCRAGFTGRHCETDLNECASSPCVNNSTCTDLPGLFSCQCVPGYSGNRCQTDIDECASAPCYSNATCVDGVDGFTCVCPENVTGVTCSGEHTCPAGFVSYEDQQRCYYIEEERSEQLDRHSAQAACQSKGATLANLETLDEMNFVGRHFTWTGRYHIVGGLRQSSDAQFHWDDGIGPPIDSGLWEPGNPSGSDCVAAILDDLGGDTTLYSLTCSDARPYVCERGGI